MIQEISDTSSPGLVVCPLAGSLWLLDECVEHFSEDACVFSVAQPDGTQILFPKPQ